MSQYERLVGEWRLNPSLNELRRGDEALRLERKVIEVLAYLAERSGQVVDRQELLAAIWPGVVVGDDVLSQAILKLRKALDDDANAPHYIETIPKRGYRLIAPVAAAPAPAAASPHRLPRPRAAGGAALPSSSSPCWR